MSYSWVAPFCDAPIFGIVEISLGIFRRMSRKYVLYFSGCFQPPPALSYVCVCIFVPQMPQVRTKTVAAIKVNLQMRKKMKSKATKILIKPPAFIHLVQTNPSPNLDRPVGAPKMLLLFGGGSCAEDILSVAVSRGAAHGISSLY